MNSEFEQLLALLSAPVIDLLNEQESCENGNNILDLSVIPIIHQSGGQYDEIA